VVEWWRADQTSDRRAILIHRSNNVTPFRRFLFPLLLIVLLAVFTLIVVTATDAATVTIEWSTASELDTAGFNLNRGETQDGPFTRINADLIPASPDPLIGGSYTFTDTTVVAGRTYFYQLEDVETSGAATAQGVVEVKAEGGLDPAVLVALAAVGLAIVGVMTFVARQR
jgi:hypothetical protein